jgi:ribosomal protein S18 acetylase RimI-like enzyme
MKFATVTYNDLGEIRHLQPEGWPDIVKDFKFYLDADFCLPVKKVLGKRIIGVGAAIVLGDSAWIAHIIVDSGFRKRGIGFSIVEELMKKLQGFSIRSYLLIATEMGKSLYERAGFKAISEYAYFQREIPWNNQTNSGNVFPCETAFYSEILELDRKISGEKRGGLLMDHLPASKVYIHHNSVSGAYFPELGEGLIIANTLTAGIELMKVKYATRDKAVLPENNEAGISFLEQHGFTRTPAKGTRMVLGEGVKWEPAKIFSRIGGNLG